LRLITKTPRSTEHSFSIKCRQRLHKNARRADAIQMEGLFYG